MNNIFKVLKLNANSSNFSFAHFSYIWCLSTTNKLSFVNKLSQKFYSFSSSSFSSPQLKNECNIQLSNEYPDAKKILWRIINKAFTVYQNPQIRPKMTINQIEGKNNQKMWRVSISMSWPEKFEADAVAIKKCEAERLVYIKCCQQMKQYGVLDSNNDIVLTTSPLAFSKDYINKAKGILSNLYIRIWAKTGNKEYIPRFKTCEVDSIFGKESYWNCQLNVTYPEKITFESSAFRLKEAEGIAAAKAIQWLKEKCVINNKCRLLNYTIKDEQRLREYQMAPCSISIPSSLQDKISDVFQDLKCQNIENTLKELESKLTGPQEPQYFKIYDLITEKLYETTCDSNDLKRSKQMLDQYACFKENSNLHVQNVQFLQRQLPIHFKKEDILKLVNENQVVIISGETGCGKTTQVPQYILDYYVNTMQGAKCNIIVTQPRRISTISIAERVAYERNLKVGDTIGYQIRLNKILPQEKGAILFSSTGMLLRKLCSNPNLLGISHVIVDEVHERNIQIDLLLILLKRVLKTNKNLKVLIMSASFNTSIFSQYFDNCSTIHIPGKVYPVKDFFLEDLNRFIPNINTHHEIPILNPELVASVIYHIHKTHKEGAILCFLPGWHDILSVNNHLLSINNNSSLVICFAHSQLSHETQQKIFDKPPEGTRKVVLATNIAETSITIDDVVYVVNSGLHKKTSFDEEEGVASLGTHWITKANVRQCRGRAGRVQSGFCFNLFSRKVFMAMEDYPVPELLRVPLEKVILDCKLYCPESKAEDFLSLAIQPPNQVSLQVGVHELQISGILDENENLTTLGKIIVNFATHPRLSLALIYASFLRCLNPVLSICAILTLGKEPFISTLETKNVIKDVKRQYDSFLFSDHLSLSKIFDSWEEKNTNAKEHVSHFIEENYLDEHKLQFIKGLKTLFAEDLHKAKILNKNSISDSTDVSNTNASRYLNVLAALSAAFFPNLIKVVQGEISHGKLTKDTITYSLLKGQHGYIQKESISSNEHNLPSPWLIFFTSLQSEVRRLIMVSNVSSIPGICLPLFAGKQLIHYQPNDEKTELSILRIDDHKTLAFSCSKSEADIILKLRYYLKSFFNIYIYSLKTESEDSVKLLEAYYTKLLPILVELLETPHVPFSKGESYKFVDNKLISQELWTDN